MLLLALDCSTSRGSVALARGTGEDHFHIFWCREFAAGRGHGGEMFTALQEALHQAREAGEPLTAILVGLGPGSYSGVRQAIAATTGLAAATSAPLRGLPSVVGFTGGTYDSSGQHVVGDARRGTFYYTAVSDRVCVVGPELLASAAELNALLKQHPDWDVLVVESALPNGLLPDARITMPLAGNLFAAPFSTWQEPPLEPIYLRPVNITLPGTAKAREP